MQLSFLNSVSQDSQFQGALSLDEGISGDLSGDKGFSRILSSQRDEMNQKISPTEADNIDSKENLTVSGEFALDTEETEQDIILLNEDDIAMDPDQDIVHLLHLPNLKDLELDSQIDNTVTYGEQSWDQASLNNDLNFLENKDIALQSDEEEMDDQIEPFNLSYQTEDLEENISLDEGLTIATDLDYGRSKVNCNMAEFAQESIDNESSLYYENSYEISLPFDTSQQHSDEEIVLGDIDEITDTDMHNNGDLLDYDFIDNITGAENVGAGALSNTNTSQVSEKAEQYTLSQKDDQRTLESIKIARSRFFQDGNSQGKTQDPQSIKDAKLPLDNEINFSEGLDISNSEGKGSVDSIEQYLQVFRKDLNASEQQRTQRSLIADNIAEEGMNQTGNVSLLKESKDIVDSTITDQLDLKDIEFKDNFLQNNQITRPNQIQQNTQAQMLQGVAQTAEKFVVQKDSFQETLPDMVKFSLSQNKRKAEIVLNPKELGEVSIDIESTQAGQYKVTIVTQSAGASELFLKHQHILEKSFIEQGADQSQLSFDFRQQNSNEQQSESQKLLNNSFNAVKNDNETQGHLNGDKVSNHDGILSIEV